MVCNSCGCPGAELLFQAQSCVNRRCHRFRRDHWRRFEAAWAADSLLFEGERVQDVVAWLANGGPAKEHAW